MNNFRLFAGIPLAEEVTDRLSAMVTRMAESLPFRRWTHPADLHVTLHFLGDTPAERAEAVRAAVSEAASKAQPLTLALTAPGTFGPAGAPRVLWCGLAEPLAPGALAALHAALGSKLAAAGCKLEDRPFRAHVTLARQGGAGCRREDIEAAWHAALQSGGIPNAQADTAHPLAWTADRVVLFQSHIGRRPSYERMNEFPLSGKRI